MERYICIHGHFYQPPRENPWLESIELQDSAYPYHDWNERVCAESYAPNAASRILDEHGRILTIVNNYSKISFNLGPTLLAWMQDRAPDVYAAVIKADMESRERFSGHGSAMAQAYNHMIMPLANSRDKYTQAVWGLRDFEHRFGRQPEGMWLPETAVDLETLDILAGLGIRFTVLAPHQAKQVRPLNDGGGDWTDVTGARIDPSTPYLQRLPSGREITLFFYDGPVSRGVAFEGLLRQGDQLANRLTGLFTDNRPWPQLAHIATDGETYGHHHKFGDMALAYALQLIEQSGHTRLTNYGEFLEKHPPLHEVQIIENTAWSCAHGMERWRGNCGCSSGLHGGWHQEWRRPLRAALDWLRDSLAQACEQRGAELFKDLWKARDEYIALVLARSPEDVERFLQRHAARRLEPDEQARALKLMELQRHAMLMYTSCGWFFDDISGIETVQVIEYAGRALQLAQELFGNHWERGFLRRLAAAKSNIAEHQDGRAIFEKLVRPAKVDLQRVGAHYAISSVFVDYPVKAEGYCYTFDRERQERFQSGRAGMIIGRARVTSSVTRESELLIYGALHFGDHNLNGGVRPARAGNHFEAMVKDMGEAFSHADFPEVIRLMDRHFGESSYSLRSLFRDEQRRVLDLILTSTLTEAEADYRRVYDRNFTLMRFLADLRIPLPQGFRAAARFVLTSGLRQSLQQKEPDPQQLERVLDEARGIDVTPDESGLGYLLESALDRMIEGLSFHPDNLELLQKIEAVVVVAKKMPFEVNFRTPQNVYYRLLQGILPRFREKAGRGDAHAQAWVTHFTSLGDLLSVRVS